MTTGLPLKVAWRYLKGKKSGNAVPLLSKISMVAIGIGAAALIILFSVSNGFNDLIKDLYNVFYPQLRIMPLAGKFVAASPSRLQQLKSIKDVQFVVPVIEDNVLIEANEEQAVATLKGVTNEYIKMHGLQPYIFMGLDSIHSQTIPTAIIGAHIAGDMGIDVNNVFSRLHIFYPNGNEVVGLQTPEQAFNRLDVKPDGVFKVQEDFDTRYILAPYDETALLLGQQGHWSTIELGLMPGADIATVKRAVQKVMGAEFEVQTRYEQNKSLFNIMNSEKIVMYFILLLVLIIASFNMVGALLLLVVEKQKDITIMTAMGMKAQSVAAIYRWEGVLWAMVGGTLGLILGVLICLGQQHYGWVGMGDAFVIDAYPVALRFTDAIAVLLTVMGVGLLASLYPAHKAKETAMGYQ